MIDLVKQIQGGRADLLPVLWEMTKAYIEKAARKRHRQASGSGSMDRHGAEVQDYQQAGFIALTRAVEKYDAEKGIPFLAYLQFYLKTEFDIAAGRRSQKQRHDPIHTAERLEDPIDEDGTELQEIIPGGVDPADLAQKKIDNAGLRIQLEDLISMLPAPQAIEVRASFFDGKTAEERARESGIPISQIRSRLYRGVENLQGLMDRTRKGQELMQFLDTTTPWASFSGLRHFTETGASAVEALAMQRERRWKKLGSVLIEKTQETK